MRLKLRKKQRRVQVTNLQEAKYVGVVFDSSELSFFQEAERFINYLKDKNLKVKAAGYVPNRHSSYTASIPSYIFFDYTDFNLLGKPKKGELREFISQKYDIFIDLCLEENYPCTYTAALSGASFKVGPFRGEKAHYDFMIDMGRKQEQEYYIDMLKQYLTEINQTKKV